MDEQKQIEEMAKIICKSGANNADCDKCGFNRECSKFKDAKAIYNAGYRKIPENAVLLTEERLKAIIEEEYKKALKGKVVLTREEYTNYIVEYMGVKEIKERVRKETAEKFAERLKDFINFKSKISTCLELKRDIIDYINEMCEELMGE